MKFIARTITSLVLAVLWLGTIAYAQAPVQVVKVHIPFEFIVGDRSFPSGDYSLAQTSQNFLVLRDQRGQSVATAFTIGIDAATPPADTKLRFASAGGRHVLTEVWLRQDPRGQRLVLAKPRVALARHQTLTTGETASGSRP
jgi:hypothetical protein